MGTSLCRVVFQARAFNLRIVVPGAVQLCVIDLDATRLRDAGVQLNAGGATGTAIREGVSTLTGPPNERCAL